MSSFPPAPLSKEAIAGLHARAVIPSNSTEREIIFSHADSGVYLAQAMCANILSFTFESDRTMIERSIEFSRRSIPWLEEQSSLGCKYASYFLGFMLDSGTLGTGLEANLPRAITLYRASASQGFCFGQLALGQKYLSGTGVPKDIDEGIAWLQRAADQGSQCVEAQFRLGELYLEGTGTTVNLALASLWIRRAAENKHPQAVNVVSKLPSNEDDMATLSELARLFAGVMGDHNQDSDTLTELAVSHPLAQAMLTGLLFRGLCCTKDEPRALAYGHASLPWLERRAAVPCMYATYFLGMFYDFGIIKRRDVYEAARLYRISADLGYSFAQCDLAWGYEMGEGVTQDFNESLRLLRLAVNQGCAMAQSNLGKWHELGFHGIIPLNMVEAVRLYQLAADQGLAAGTNNLGQCYLRGNGLPKNLMEAARLFSIAAKQGHSIAQFNLGCCYETGDGVIRDLIEAKKCFVMAAAQGYEPAVTKLRSRYN